MSSDVQDELAKSRSGGNERVPGKATGECKGPEVGVRFVCSRSRNKSTVVGVGESQGEDVRRVEGRLSRVWTSE